MPSPDRRAHFEDVEDSSAIEDSSSYTTSSAGSIASEYPKKGKTKIPTRLISRRALIDLGYPYSEEGDTTIVQKALGQENINELLKLSEEYNEVDKGLMGDIPGGYDTSFQEPISVIRVDVGSVMGSQVALPTVPVFSDRKAAKVPTTDGNQFASDCLGDPRKPPWRDQVLLSGILSLNRTGQQSGSESGDSETLCARKAWRHPKSFVEDGAIATELFNIHAAECYMDQAGAHKVTLSCPNPPEGSKDVSSLVRMRWLHLKGFPSKLRTLENLVTDCPFISQHLKSVALNVLMEVNRRCLRRSESGSEIETGTVIRYIGRYQSRLGRYANDPAYDTEPVIFLSTPFLFLPEKFSKGRLKQGFHSKTLLEFLYGYEAGSVRQKPFGVSRLKTERDNAQRSLRVSQTWFLIIGSATLISFSELSSQEMSCDNIQFDRKALGSTPGIFTVRVVDNARMCRYHIVIDRDCNYVNFLRRATALARSEQANASTYMLVDEQGGLVDPETWLSLLASGDVENHVFGLRTKGTAMTEEVTADFRALSIKLLNNGREVDGGYTTGEQLQGPVDLNNSPQGREEMQLIKQPAEELRCAFNANPDGHLDLSTYGYSERSSKLRHSPTGSFIPAPRRLTLAKVPELYNIDDTPSMVTFRHQDKDLTEKQIITTGAPQARIVPRSVNNYTVSGLLEPAPALSEPESRTHHEWEAMPINIMYSRTTGDSLQADNDIQPPPTLPFCDDDMDSLDDFGSGQQVDPEDQGVPLPPTFSRDQSLVHSTSPSIVEDRLVPFLTWRLTWNADERSLEETDKTLVQLLNKIHGSLASSRYGKLYLESFQCTREDVTLRCQTLCSVFDKQSAASIPREVGGAEKPHPNQQQANVSDAQSKSALFRTLLEVSESIFTDFLPISGSSSAHPLCERFWGTLDCVMRQIYLSSIRFENFHEPNWVTIQPYSPFIQEGVPNNLSRKLPSHQCTNCREEAKYSLGYAVRHLHSEHIQCPYAYEGTKILDDPCLGWVHYQGLNEEADENVLSIASAHVANLIDIRDKARDLHCSVSGVSESNKATSCRPHLLSSLVYAFEGILGKYVLAAKELSLANRMRLRKTNLGFVLSTPKSPSMIRDWSKSIEKGVHEYLSLAKRDIIILGTTQADIDRLIIAPVGPEFIVTTLISNIQNNTILQGVARKLDITNHYRKVSAGLRFGAVRDPKRRRFLEISALEEELEALQAMYQVQRRFVRAYRKVLEPAGFQSTTTDWAYLKDRQAMYPLETKPLDLQDQKLTNDSEALATLNRIAQVTRHDMKQSIEVLEEGHGKAIRVFTFVTLFFLPLSFVTSFLGMNTTDVRDTDWDQRIFWSSAVPVTVVVLTLALIYGYKWDVVVETFSKGLNAEKSPEPYGVLEEDIMPLVGDTSFSNEDSAPVHTTQKYRTTLATRLGQVIKKRPRRKKQESVPRRQTNDSLLA